MKDDMNSTGGSLQNETDVQALHFAREKGVPAEDLPLFVAIYTREHVEYKKISEEIDDWEGSFKEATLSWYQTYKQMRDKGFSELWSRAYADDYFIQESEDWAAAAAYAAVQAAFAADSVDNENNPVFAEAYSFALRQGKSQRYCTHYAEGIVEGRRESSARKFAEEYEEAWELKKKEGFSDLYAEKYASEIAHNSTEAYATIYARTYDQAIHEGKSEFYAHTLADKFAYDYNDAYCRVDEIDEGYLSFIQERAFIQAEAREYARVHELSQGEIFVEACEHHYLNGVFKEEGCLPPQNEKAGILQQSIQAGLQRITQ